MNLADTQQHLQCRQTRETKMFFSFAWSSVTVTFLSTRVHHDIFIGSHDASVRFSNVSGLLYCILRGENIWAESQMLYYLLYKTVTTPFRHTPVVGLRV